MEEDEMQQSVLSDEEIVRRGQRIYNEQLRARLEPGENGRFVVINPRNGDFALADTTTDAGRVMRARYPDEVFYEVRVGHEFVSQFVGPGARDAARKP